MGKIVLARMLRKTSVILIIALAASLFGACTINQGDLTALATRNVHVPASATGEKVEGRDCIYWVLFLPITGSLYPNLEEAIDRALAKAPRANALQNAVLYEDLFTILLFQENCYRVTGEAVRVDPSGV